MSWYAGGCVEGGDETSSNSTGWSTTKCGALGEDARGNSKKNITHFPPFRLFVQGEVCSRPPCRMLLLPSMAKNVLLAFQ